MKTDQEMAETREAEAARVAAIKKLREDLLDAGYVHANNAGELVSADGTTWVSTTYTHAEYSIYAWRRPRGRGELGELRNVMRVTLVTDIADIQKLARRLSLWAKHVPHGVQWPPVGMAATCR